MKKIIVLIILINISNISFGQSYLNIEENNLKLGGLPKQPELKSITLNKAQSIFNVISNENIEYRYVNGSCEDRAHFISMILRKNDVNSGKIWAFSPSKYTLISKEQIIIKDPYGINDQVKWGYHVAPILVVESDTLVIDLSFDNKNFLKKKDWLKKLNSKNAIYFYTISDDYLFNTIGGDEKSEFTAWRNDPKVPNDNINIKLPHWLPSIISGDFFSLDDTNNSVYKGLAINDLAIKVYELSSSNIPDTDKKYLKQIVKNIDNVEKEIADNNTNVHLTNKTFSILKDYYLRRFEYWKKRFEYYKS